MKRWRDHDRDAIARRYMRAFLFLGGIVIAGLIMTEYQLAQQQTSARTINIAGRQRMLSQRITKNVLKIAGQNSDSVDAYEQLQESLDIFTASHRALRFGDAELGITIVHGKDVEKMYQELEPIYQKIVTATTAVLANTSEYDSQELTIATEVLTENESAFLTRMNDIVFALDAETTRRQQRLRFFIYILYGTLLIVLCVIWYAIIRRAIQRSREIDASKSEFVSIASQELSAPVQSIKSYIALLEQEKVSPQQEHLIEGIKETAKRMDRLATSLTEVSRMELRQFAIKPIPMDWSSILSETTTKMVEKGKQKGITISTSIDHALPDAAADATVLKRIVINILTNAIHFTPSGGHIDVVFRLKNRRREILISDTGIGIPKDAQERIFEKFFRADNARKMDPDGFGLGLYIVRTLVEAAGGDIRFTSSTDGTMFYIAFPHYGMDTYSDESVPSKEFSQ